MSEGALGARFDGVVCDLDGVVLAGAGAIEHAVPALNALEAPVVFATNNASRSPHQVGEHLRELGVVAGDERILTSALAAARVLAQELRPGSPVMAVGGPGVGEALQSVGLRVWTPRDASPPVAVVQGYGPGVSAADLGEVAHAVRAGARWVATNDDLTLPTERGPAPGNGSLVGAVRNAVDVDPTVIGKPHPPIYEMAAQILRAEPARVLAIGDRLETDIQGAVATGLRGALVVTGVHGPADAAAAPFARRPDHVLTDLRELHEDYPAARREGPWHVRGQARARVTDDLEIEGEGIDATRAALDALWEAVDDGRLDAAEAGRAMATR